MNDLISIKNRQAVTGSRQIAEVFNKRHDHILRDLDELKKGVTQNWGDLFYETTYIHKQNKQEYREVLMNRDGFTLLAMGFTGKKAMEWKLKYIKAFNKMEKIIKEELRPQVEIDSNFMYQIAQEMEEKEKQIKEMEPKALFADAVTTSKTSILVGELAKLISQNGVEIGQNRLFKWLRANGFLIKRRGESYNTPTQYSMDLGLMETKVRTISNPDGSVRTTRTTKVTGKGQVYFINKFLDRNKIDKNKLENSTKHNCKINMLEEV